MESHTDDIEIIEFSRPLYNNKNLYITSLSLCFQESELEHVLYETFSKYGLLYEVQVIPSMTTSQDQTTAISDQQDSGTAGFYAFVKFYSYRAAAKAKKELTGRLFYHGQHAKIKFANRKNVLSEEIVQSLYVSKCYDLANYYLGFDGWTTHILAMRPDEGYDATQKIRFICIVKLNLPRHGVHAEAVGLGEQTWNPNDPLSRGVAVCKAKKQAHQRATENAFGKVVLVIMADGRLHVEVNTTVEEALHYDEDLNQCDMIKVNELDEDPEDNEDVMDEDDRNMQMLQELEDG